MENENKLAVVGDGLKGNSNRSKGTKSNPAAIILRERGTKKIHIFKGWKALVPAPKNKPSWMPDKINKPNVKKAGVEKLKKI